MLRHVVTAIVVATMTMPANAADPVQLYAAGSLRSALTEVATAFEAAVGLKVQAKFGPSGTLKDEIAAGARADVFASANMEHPQALASARKSGPVVLFARNKLCALARPGVAVETATLLDRMLDPQVKLSVARVSCNSDQTGQDWLKQDLTRAKQLHRQVDLRPLADDEPAAAVVRAAQEDHCDLLLLGVPSEFKGPPSIEVNWIVRHAPCRVCVIMEPTIPQEAVP